MSGPKYARVVQPAPEPFIYACLSLDGTRAAAILKVGDEFVVHGIELNADTAVPLYRGQELVETIKWSCRWAGRKGE